ncbi:MAG: 3'-5' exonuclease [Chloroflexi bacterium]|nr:3'-5' exonuclease [Chloroflexota bacterium]
MLETHNIVQVIRSGNFVVLDTETTGLNRWDEICQIAVVNSHGHVLMDTYVKPAKPIPADATRIHGITNDMVMSAPNFAGVVTNLVGLLSGMNVIVYNALYDRKMLHQSADAIGLAKTDWRTLSRWWCAMETFAEIYGEWNSYHQSYKWQTLSTASRYYNPPVIDAHSALGDCQMTLAVCRAMAEAVK